MIDSQFMVRPFSAETDYKEACEWWKKRNWSPVPLDHLPATGFVIYEGEIKHAAIWLYLTNTAFAWLEFLIANPEAPLRTKKPALEQLVAFTLSAAQKAGIRSVFTSLSNKNLIKLYEARGFQISDREVTHLVARIN